MEFLLLFVVIIITWQHLKHFRFEIVPVLSNVSTHIFISWCMLCYAQKQVKGYFEHNIIDVLY
jgi:hypothetical protein